MKFDSVARQLKFPFVLLINTMLWPFFGLGYVLAGSAYIHC